MSEPVNRKKSYAFLEQTRKRFSFLQDNGFKIVEEYEGDYGSFKSGFWLEYRTKLVEIRIVYGDMEFHVYFKKGSLRTDYLFLDKNLNANASGYAGCMFPLNKLALVIDEIAADIAANYIRVLNGEEMIWQRIEKLLNAPQEKKPNLP